MLESLMTARDAGSRPPIRGALAQAVTAALVFLAGAVACEWTLYTTAERVLRATVDDELAQLARLAASVVDVDRHSQLTRPNQLNGADYREVVAPLRRLRASLPMVRYIYTVRSGVEGPEFVVDAAPPLDTDEDGVLDQSALGEVYETPDPAMLTALERGAPTVTEAAYSDRWGTFNSAYHPLRGADGRLEAVLGVDVNAAEYLSRTEAMRGARDAGLAAAAIFAGLLGVLVFAVQRMRQSAVAELALSESRFRSFFELGVVGMVVLDAQERVVAANASLGALIDRDPASLVGMPWSSLLLDRSMAHSGRAESKDSSVRDAQLVHPSGLSIEVEVARRGVPDPRGVVHHHVVLVSDVRARNLARRELTASLAQSEATLAAITTVARDPAMAEGDVRAVARALTPLAAAALDVERASVWRYSDTAGVLACLDQYSRTTDEHTAGRILRRADLEAEFRALEAAPYIDAHDASTDPRVAGLVDVYIRPAGITSMLDVRVRGSGRLLGVVCFEHVQRPHVWVAREIALACQLADQIALAMLHGESRVAADTLREARDAAADASRAKGQFLATMSHEIRTPINAVIGFTGLLADTPLSPDQHEYLSTIRSSGEALLTIINDVLDFSKIEAGKLDIAAEPFALAPLVAEVARMVRPRLTAVALSLEFGPGLPTIVAGDAGRVRQILLNLLGNAVKFTSRGGVAVEVTAPTVGAIRFAVHDSGVGIAPENQAKIFGQFSQADASTTRRFGGTGLGLAISKRLVELMGGEIGFSTAEGVGSTFWFCLPLAAAVAPVAAATTPREARPRSALSVLVAEDNITNRALMRRLLERHGCKVTLVEDGRGAVSAATAAAYDVVLMDCQMPELDGLDATRAIRAAEHATGRPRTPIVALTANAMAGDRERCLAAGMDDYVTKPVRAEALERALDQWGWSRQPRPSKPDVQSVTSTTKVDDSAVR
jgi:signal transduction histidine kinase/FixJ family two-component response regulator/PAS domain-containing protein